MRVCTTAIGILLGLSFASAHDLEGLGNRSMSYSSTVNLRVLRQFAEQLPDPDARYVYSRLLLWNPGEKLVSCFENGTQEEKTFVVTAANELLQGKDVNISFDFGEQPTFRPCKYQRTREDVRISFSNGCCAAYVGRTSLARENRDEPSVFLQGVLTKETRKATQVVMHELLHALGLNHEHQSPNSVCEPEFNKDAVLAAFKWNEDQYRTNLKRLDLNSRKYKWSEYDQASIMKYFFEPKYLKQGTASVCYSVENYLPSVGDYEGLRDAYPVNPQVSPDKARNILNSDGFRDAPIELKNFIEDIRRTY